MSDKKDYSWIWWIIIPAAIFVFYLFSTSSSNLITVKYRDSKVDISNSRWEVLDKNDSDVRNAWYDNDNQYMIIKLNGTYYHYCGMPEDVWASFMDTESSSLDGFYLNSIKGEYDCRQNPVPEY